MITIQGKGVSAGAAVGPLYFLQRPADAVCRRRVESPDAEKARFAAAQAQAVRQLEALARQHEKTPEAAELLLAHAMLAEDEDFAACVAEKIEKEKGCAEYAVEQAAKQFAAMLETMEDPYMQARAADIGDVARRIIGQLTGNTEPGFSAAEPVILCAEDLLPSETVQIDREKLLGLVTRRGSANSHVAILARTMGIPAVCGVGDALPADCTGKAGCIDGKSGKVVIEPDAQTLAGVKEQLEKQAQQQKRLEALRGQEDITPDGRRLMLYCNIGAPQDVEAVKANDGRGIGLFRSEFLYLGVKDLPGEEEQFAAYRVAAEAMDGKRVIIRTLDIGADKQADYFKLEKEENPALGMRAIRLCLNRPTVFHTQLRALYRASAYGKVAIMFPMITAVWEVRECKRACRSVMAELEKEGIAYDPAVEIGIMIETPAAVLIADDLAKEVDFFSVGTNDLTQYTLACDRQSDELGRFFDPHHPAILRAVKMAADAAHAAGIWIGICGDLAADTDLLPTFLAMGIDELSVPPAAVLPLRAALRQTEATTRTTDL